VKPSAPSPRRQRVVRHVTHRVVAEDLNLDILHQHDSKTNPMDPDFDYRESVQGPRPGRGQGRPRGADDRQPGLVARRLGPLRRSDDPHGLARGRHLPHRRRPRRRRHRQPAVRPAELLARQRQPRQGPPPVVADQEEVRQPDQLGRPDGAGRQRGLRVHGPEDLRLRLGRPDIWHPEKDIYWGLGEGVAHVHPVRRRGRRP
jgi:hypothetical protein